MSNTGLDAINNNSTVGQIMTELSAGSLQMMFAALQLEMSESAKTQAMDRMKAIKETQLEQKKLSALIQEARQAQSDAGTKMKEDVSITYYNYNEDGTRGSVKFTKKYEKGDTCRPMSDELLHYMDANKLAYSTEGNDLKHNKDEWGVAIKSLEAHLEQLGTETQQQMVFIQDFMGQYNSYLQGAMTQVSEANRTTGALAKGQ